MKLQIRPLVLLFTLFSTVTMAVASDRAEKAAQAYEQGQKLLAQGDFEGALEAYRTAARADGNDVERTQRYALVRQVVRMRKHLPREKNDQRWLAGAASLHTFYHDEGLFSESLPLDEERFRRDPSAESAALLAETQLSLGQHSQLVELCGSLSEDQKSPRLQAMHGLALAHLGRTGEAVALAADPASVPGEAGPQCFVDLARLHALVGKLPQSMQAIVRALELTPPSRTEVMRSRIQACPEFASVRSTPEFDQALATASTVKESGCSGGTQCSKCPSRNKCGSHSSGH